MTDLGHIDFFFFLNICHHESIDYPFEVTQLRGWEYKKVVLLPKNERCHVQYWDFKIQLNVSLWATKEAQKYY